jgi:hypothetical protein
VILLLEKQKRYLYINTIISINIYGILLIVYIWLIQTDRVIMLSPVSLQYVITQHITLVTPASVPYRLIAKAECDSRAYGTTTVQKYQHCMVIPYIAS